MEKYIKPSADIVIKYLLGVKEAEIALVGFINAVLEDSGFPLIERAEVLNPFNRKNFLNDKESILDIKAVDKKGRLYNVEIQSTMDRNFKNRSLYYWARLYSNQIKEGEGYNRLNPVICINLLEFNLFPGDFVHSCFMVTEKDQSKQLSDDLEIHFIELSKLKDHPDSSHLMDWLLYFKYEGQTDKDALKEVLKVTDKNPDIKAAHDRYTEFISDFELRDRFEAHWKYQLDRNTMIYESRREGLEQGRAQGIEQGERRKSLETARKMKEENLPIDMIVRVTGLSEKEIEEL